MRFDYNGYRKIGRLIKKFEREITTYIVREIDTWLVKGRLRRMGSPIPIHNSIIFSFTIFKHDTYSRKWKQMWCVPHWNYFCFLFSPSTFLFLPFSRLFFLLLFSLLSPCQNNDSMEIEIYMYVENYYFYISPRYKFSITRLEMISKLLWQYWTSELLL